MEKYSDIVAFVRSAFYEPVDYIPLHDPRFIGNEKKYLSDCVDSNFVSSLGAYVGKFEQMCADYTGAKYAVAAMNGTSALHIALQLAGVCRGDEVLTQALTFIATANAISYTGAEPVFLDVDVETLGISPDAVSAWLDDNAELRQYNASSKDCFSLQSPKTAECAYNKKTGRRISACIPMHTFGHPVKLNELINVLNEWHIPLVEDAAESIGSSYDGKQTGTFGLMGILSFNGNKLITTGGGGMILTDDERLASLAKHLTTQAKVPHAWEFVHDFIGYNYRLTNLNAALGCAQMEQLDYLLSLKRQLAEQYKDFFANTEYVFFKEPVNCNSNYWLNAILTKDRLQRDEILEYTNKNGIMTRPIWELMNRLPIYSNCQTDSLENSIWIVDRLINIPSGAPIKGYRK